MGYLDHGVPKDKLVVGMAFYGRGFTLKDPQMNGLYCDADDGIPKGPFSRQIGIWGYDEIIGKMQGKLDIDLPEETGTWTIVRDDCYKAPYAYNGPYWIGYDDEDSIRVKAKFINFLDVAGAMVWSIDTDDFKGGNTHAFPLLHAIHDGLASGETFDPENPHCKGTAPMCP